MQFYVSDPLQCPGQESWKIFNIRLANTAVRQQVMTSNNSFGRALQYNMNHRQIFQIFLPKQLLLNTGLYVSQRRYSTSSPYLDKSCGRLSSNKVKRAPIKNIRTNTSNIFPMQIGLRAAACDFLFAECELSKTCKKWKTESKPVCFFSYWIPDQSLWVFSSNSWGETHTGTRGKQNETIRKWWS